MKIPFTCRVLYAESDEDGSAMMNVLLGFAGIEVVAAKTVAEAWHAAQSEHFDLFLLDSQFPVGDGLELCRRLRRYFSRSPIFFYSGRAYEIDRKNGLDAGADEYLIKPNSDNLPERILSAVKLSRKNEENQIESSFTEAQKIERRKAAIGTSRQINFDPEKTNFKTVSTVEYPVMLADPFTGSSAD